VTKPPTPTPSDYIGDACKILGLSYATLFGPERTNERPHCLDRRRVFLHARKLAAEDYTTFVAKEWAAAMGQSESMIWHYDKPKVTRNRFGNIDDVIAVALNVCGVRREALGGTTRHPDVVRCRMLITRAARTVTDCSYPDIARAIGRPNHSTVITASQRFDELTEGGKCPHLIDMLARIVSECDRLTAANKPIQEAA